MTFAAVAIGGAAVIGGAIAAGGATSAANTQADAARNAQNISQNEFQQIQGQEQPFIQGGYGALQQLNYGLGTGGVPDAGAAPGVGAGSFNQPFTADYMKQYSPAYQFNLQQGQQGVLNQDARAYGGESGAALKDLTSFNQNYANNSFNNAFNQYQTQTQNTYGRLANIANLGQSAVSQTAQSGTALAGQSAQSAQNIGTAQAAGTVGAANAYSGAAGTLGMLPFLSANTQAGGFNPAGNNYNLGSGTGGVNIDPSTGLPALGSIP